MSASISSAITSKPTVIGQSRTDLRSGDVVTLTAADLSHTTYSWTLAFAPESPDGTASSASLSTSSGTGPITFTVDNEGSYLIRLVVDSGLGTEDTQWVALRYLTVFGDLSLVAAGERRDDDGVIPVDADAEGWANAQNQNLQTLLGYVQTVSTSGRTITVDANRGRDISNSPNDPTIAEGFADHSTISSAISEATGLTPAPSLSDPVVIKVFPGFYEEDLSFAAHVHIVGDTTSSGDESDRSVVVRTTSAGTQIHTANLTSAGDLCYVSNLTLETVDASSNAVLSKQGSGTLFLHRVSVIQNGNDASQGPALDNAGDGTLIAQRSLIKSNNSVAADRLAFFTDTANSTSVFEECDIIGPSAVDLANSDPVGVSATFQNCFIDSTFADASAFSVRTSADETVLERSNVTISGGVNSTVLDVHPSGGVHVNDLIVEVRWSRLEGDIDFDTTGVSGDTDLRLGASDFGAINVTGSLTNQDALVEGLSIAYDPTTSGLSTTDVQNTLDLLAAVTTATGLGGSALTLDTAYDGVVDPTVPTFGSGSGRSILADQGAVVIQAADPPNSSPVVGQSDGQLQVEGNVQVGGIGSPELDLDPNPFGVGPMILGGRLDFPDIGSVHRAIPAFIIRGNSTGTPLFHTFNLLTETRSVADASRDEVGRVILKAGDSLAGGSTPPHAGQVFIQAGDGFDATGDPGEVWISPGRNDTLTTDGRLNLTNPGAATSGSLTANGAFVGGVAGDITFYVSGVGDVTASILVSDALADVQTKLNALDGVSCQVSPGNDPIEIVTDQRGSNAEVYFTQDDQGGALNTALGDFSIGGGALFTTGDFPELIALGATAADELTVFGDMVVTGTISGTALLHASTHIRGGSDEIDGDQLDIDFTPTYYTPDTTPAEASNVDHLTAHLAGIDERQVTVNRSTVSSSPYNVTDTDHYLGLDTTGGPITVNLQSTATGARDGRVIMIVDEAGDAAANPITIQVSGGGSVHGDPSLVLNQDKSSVALVANGLTGASTIWYIMP